MISGHILTKALKELQDLTNTELVLVGKAGELYTDRYSVTAEYLRAVPEFLESAADSMVMQDFNFFKVYESDRAEYVLIAKGSQAEVTGRIAVSELTNILSVAYERTDKNHFIQNVLLDNLIPTDLREEARKLKIREDTPRIVYLIGSTEDDHDIALQTLKAIYTVTNGDFITSIDPTHIAVVTTFYDGESEEAIRHFAAELENVLSTEAMLSVHVSYGNAKEQLMNLSQSYKEAQLAMEVGSIFYPEDRIISYNNLGIGRLIYQLPQSLCEIFMKENFDHDIFKELDEETMVTIRTFFNNNLNISETARQLYIHRNTLVYRLEKLERTTGCDIRKFDEAMTFKIAMMVEDYMNHMR